MANTEPMRKLKPHISGFTVPEKNPPRLSSPMEATRMNRYAAIYEKNTKPNCTVSLSSDSVSGISPFFVTISALISSTSSALSTIFFTRPSRFILFR